MKTLLAIVIFLLLQQVVTGCASSTPATSRATSQAPISPFEDLELDLAVTAPPSYQLAVTPIYSGQGLCFLGSFVMLAKYDEPSIDFSDCICSSGLGPSGFHVPDKPTGLRFSFYGGMEASLALMPRNLGYNLIVGVGKGGRIDSQLSEPIKVGTAAKLPDLKDVSVRNEAKRIEYFDNVDGAFSFLKRVVASGYPVEVHLNVVWVMDDFAKVSPKWQKDAEIWRSLDQMSHFMVVTGYDASYVYLSDPTDPDKPTNLPATIGNFKSAWTVPEGMTQNDAGPYWMLFIKRGEGKKSADDILDWNKKRSATTPNEIKALSEQCPPCGASAPTDERDIDMITVIRSEYAKFSLKRMAEVKRRLCTSSQPPYGKVFLRVAT